MRAFRSLRLVPLNAVRRDPTRPGMIWYLRPIISNSDMTSQDGVMRIGWVCVCVCVCVCESVSVEEVELKNE